jgi:hypothetical protein
MRNKLFALILALTVVSWAQTATQTTPTQSAPAAETTKAACCDKMAADSKDGHAACMRSSKMSDDKEMASCCGGKETASCCGKDSKSCMKDEKSAASCCKDARAKDKTASCCDRKTGKECGKGCCGSNKSEKPA